MKIYPTGQIEETLKRARMIAELDSFPFDVQIAAGYIKDPAEVSKAVTEGIKSFAAGIKATQAASEQIRRSPRR